MTISSSGGRLGPALLLLALCSACGERDVEPDPAAIDLHLNKIIAREAAEHNQLVVESRQREAVRKSASEERLKNNSE